MTFQNLGKLIKHCLKAIVLHCKNINWIKVYLIKAIKASYLKVITMKIL